jgi:hypothetical protein
MIILLPVFGLTVFSQVGVGTSTPDNSAMLEVSSNSKGFLLPRMTSIQRLAVTAPQAGLQVYDNQTNSIWYFNGAYWVDTQSMASIGDVKSGIQTADHNGWVKLDGRLLTSLSPAQQLKATSLGLSLNLPNASEAYLVQNGNGMGSVSGSNINTLTQANLPNVTFSGSAAGAGSHSHTTDPVAFNSSNAGLHAHSSPDQNLFTASYTHNHGVGDGTNAYNNVNQNVPGLMRRTLSGEALTTNGLDAVFSGEEADLRNPPKVIPNDTHGHGIYIPSTTTNTIGEHNHVIDVPSTTSSVSLDHIHSVMVSSGGSATPINIAPKSMSVNMFIYLGL